MTALLEIRELHKSFDGVRAVGGISFNVDAGRITGLIGPNGSGKSTTIDCISGFQSIDGGKVLLAGVDITGRATHEIARAGLMRTFQTVRVFDHLSLRDNLLIAAQQFDDAHWGDELFRTARYRRAVASAEIRARELIDLVGLSRFIDAEAGILSYGQRKLVALAAALMPPSKIVVLDEPVAGVNPTRIREVEQIVRKLSSAGQTFLIVEHNVEFISNLCDHVIVLDQGHKLAEGAAADIQNDPRVLEAYLGMTPELAATAMQGVA